MQLIQKHRRTKLLANNSRIGVERRFTKNKNERKATESGFSKQRGCLYSIFKEENGEKIPFHLYFWLLFRKVSIP